MPCFVSFGIALTKWIHKLNILTELILLFAVIAISLVCMAAEAVLGLSSWTTIGLVAFASYCICFRVFRPWARRQEEWLITLSLIS